MDSDFVRGFLLGLVLQFSVGPVFFSVLAASVSSGFGRAFGIAVGAAAVDSMYIALSFTAASAVLSNPLISKAAGLAGMAVLIFFGVRSIIGARSREFEMEDSYRLEGGGFSYGIKLTLANPLTILFWTGTFGSLVASKTLQGMPQILSYSAGCVAATVVVLGAVSIFGDMIKGRISRKAMMIMDCLLGIILIMFGIGMAVR